MVPVECTQAIIGIAESWGSTQVRLTMVEKGANGVWQQVLGPYAGRLGRSGLVWGLGLHPASKGQTLKREGDGCSPAGVFSIGGLWLSMGQNPKRSSSLPCVKVSPADLWVSDMNQPSLYNRYIRLDHAASSPWELKEQMRQNDHAHSIKLQICHNSADVVGRPIVGAGSSIFFHIWRNNGQAVTAGCTSMDEAVLRTFIQRLDPKRRPVYILLPRAEYLARRAAWRLP